MYLTKEKIFEYAAALESSEITSIVFAVSEKKLQTQSGRFATIMYELKRFCKLGAVQVLMHHLKIKVCNITRKLLDCLAE